MKTIIDNFVPQGGKHCITNGLKQVFSYYGYPMSEEMIFGIASGLSFIYLNQAASPMVSGRTKIFEFEQKLASRLHITIKCKSGKDYARIEALTKHLIDTNNPVLIYADMPYLKYLGMDENSHFGGHAVVLFGYDDTAGCYLVSDRDSHDSPISVPSGEIAGDYHFVDYKEMERARTSSHRPFPANNKYLVFNFAGYKKIDRSVITEAVNETLDTMLYPPAQLLGINGILKFSKEILKWKKFSPEKLRQAGVTNYFQINKDGGTGGGIFRRMYGEFLIEAAPFFEDDRFIALGRKFMDVSILWDNLADALWQLFLTGDTGKLKEMSQSISNIYHIEQDLYLSLKVLLK